MFSDGILSKTEIHDGKSEKLLELGENSDSTTALMLPTDFIELVAQW